MWRWSPVSRHFSADHAVGGRMISARDDSQAPVDERLGGSAFQLLGAPAQIQLLMASSWAAGSDWPALGICVPLHTSTLRSFCIR
jgi:hypothetical protein